MKKCLFTLSLLTVPGLAWAESAHPSVRPVP